MIKKANIDNYMSSELLMEAVSNVQNTVDTTIKRTFSFKGRKSAAIIEAVINSFTKEGDYVLDPFIGSGSTIIATQNINRRLLGIELDNYTYNVTKQLFENINFVEVNKMYDIVQKKIRTDIQYLYETSCCGEKNYITKTLFDPNSIRGERDGYFNPEPHREIVDGKNVKLLYKCSICGTNAKEFDEVDWDKIQEVGQIDASSFPNDEYLENSRINITAVNGANFYDKIFTHRNKVALLKLQSAISSLPVSKEKDFLQHVLVSSLKLARTAMYGSSTDILYHVVLFKAQEMNVWELFQSQYNNFLKFKEKYAFTQTENFNKSPDYSVVNDDYADYLTNSIPNQKFDLIFTDFPYTDQVPYLERNQLFRVWLKHFSDSPELYELNNKMLEKEIVVTNAVQRPGKNYDQFYSDLDKMFGIFNQHLEEYKPVILFMKLGKQKYFQVFASIINLARKNGFEYAARVGVEKNDPTLRKQSAFNNTLINEVLVGFIKLPEEERYLYIDNINYEQIIVDIVYKLIKETNNSVLLTEACSVIKDDLLSNYKINPDSEMYYKISKVIRENFRVTEKQEVYLSDKVLYLNQEENDKETLFSKIYNLIPIFIDRLFEKNDNKFVLEDLYVELVDSLTDGTTSVFQELLDNSKNIEMIINLLEQLCDRNDKYYIPLELTEVDTSKAIDLIKMDPYDFEDLCKKLLSKEGFTDIILKGGSGDLGVDIIAKKFNGNLEETWLIQCKRWANNVDATPIQRLDSERLRLKADKVECITTSDYTRDSRMIAKEQKVKITKGLNLLKRLNKHFPGVYYNSLFQE